MLVKPKIYLLFKALKPEGEYLLSVHITAEGAMNEGNEFLRESGSEDRFENVYDLPHAYGYMLYIQEWELDD